MSILILLILRLNITFLSNRQVDSHTNFTNYTLIIVRSITPRSAISYLPFPFLSIYFKYLQIPHLSTILVLKCSYILCEEECTNYDVRLRYKCVTPIYYPSRWTRQPLSRSLIGSLTDDAMYGCNLCMMLIEDSPSFKRNNCHNEIKIYYGFGRN